MVETGTTLATEVTRFAAAYTNVILLPGPSFVVVCEAGLAESRRDASLVAIGVACGAGLLATLILQAAPMLQASPDLVLAGRVGCGMILLAMGFRMARRSLSRGRNAGLRASATAARSHFVMGFVAAATNPVSFASFTAAALTITQAGHGVDCAAVSATIFLMAVGWFGSLAIVFSQPVLTAHYGRVARILGSVMGCVLMGKALASLLSTLWKA